MSEPSVYIQGKEQILKEFDELMEEQAVDTEILGELKKFIKKVYVRGVLVGLKEHTEKDTVKIKQ